MRLYTYFRSSAAYRVRIALNLKALPYEAVPVHLLRDGGEQLGAAFRAVNPGALLPALEDGDTTVTQSLAIMEYLEERHPLVPLLPADAAGRARVRGLAMDIACDTHPLGNLRVLKYLVHTLKLDEEAKLEWLRHWMGLGLATVEEHLARDVATGRFCHGDTPSMADCCLVPQVFNARRFGLDLESYPNIARVDANCAALPAFQAAHPSAQPDAE
ncbi:maleylacetoacetate isomerase [Pseudoduganella namucuonensis]|uniref:Maleylacetoacetate isomerase n=1 Tax=Pseudoduganella namucuonensis TaxID=1035707 RepID=A0A1I7JQP0_9BURK|nr:maleylacetoacetate isomerase [Pseudoduganella namucuonensis]SFU87501.1 maleylacetoacetate isomerase [Pseudoduganella namucuonensis]